MRGLIIPTLGLLVLVAAVLVFTPVRRIVHDPAPPPEAMAQTVVVGQPLPPLPVPAIRPPSRDPRPGMDRGNDPGDSTPAAPLPRQLVIREEVPAKVPHGLVALPPGMPVELAQDKGPMVEVQFGPPKQATRTTIPRTAVAPLEMEEARASAGPLETVRRTVVSLDRAPASSIAIEAKEVGTGRGVARSYDSYVGSSDQNAYRSKGLTVTVRNLSRRPTGPCEITVYWTGRRLADNQAPHHARRNLCHEYRRCVPRHAETSWCPLLDSQVTTYDWTNVKRTSGSKFDGWFVVLTREQQLLVGRGATENYNQIIRDRAQLQPLLATWSGSSLHATGNRPLWRHERPGQTASPQEKRTTAPY